jgi:drug/metabolite transporter (DMT)-like permease
MLLGGNGLVNWAQQVVPSGIAALVVGTVPIWFVTLAWLGPDHEAPTLPEVGGIVLGLGGVGLLMSGSLDNIGLHGATRGQVLLGVGALVLATVSWAIGSLYSRRAPLARPTLLSTAMMMLTGGGLMLLAGIGLGEIGDFDAAGVTRRSLAAFAFLIVFGSIIAFSCYVWLFQVVRPALAGTYAYVNPVVAVLLGWALADEVITREMAFGAILIIGAVVLAERGRARARAAQLAAARVGASQG